MRKPSKVLCDRRFSDFSQDSRVIYCDVLVDMIFG